MKKITIETIVAGDIEKVWEYWNAPEHVMQWAFASDEWECPYAENDFQEGGKYLTRMAAKDGSESFDVLGTYTTIIPKRRIESTMEDNRTVVVDFSEMTDGTVRIVREFEMEDENSEELQRAGWQSILENFKKHVENT